MKRFVCEQNIAHFQKLLSETTDPSLQRTLQSLLSSAKRELAILNSTQYGADALPFEHHRRRLVDAQAVRQQFQPEFDATPHPYMLLDPGPGLHIVDINGAYAEATFLTQRAGNDEFESHVRERATTATRKIMIASAIEAPWIFLSRVMDLVRERIIGRLLARRHAGNASGSIQSKGRAKIRRLSADRR